MTDHTTIVLVSCTNAKRGGTHAAADLYDVSHYFRKQRAYATAVADAWYIQSAKHGLLKPDAVITDYDKHASDIDDGESWAAEIAGDVERRHTPPATVYLLGGRHYTEPLVPELEYRGFDAVTPLHGLMIGERMARLDELAAPGSQTRADGWR